MDNYKLAFIHGDEDKKRNIKVGDVEYIGDRESDLHAECLLEYANKHYEDIEIFKKLSIRHNPEVIGFMFLNCFNDIVYFNTTKNVEKYGRSGLFLLPDDISDLQKKGLLEFARTIENYKVNIFHSLRLEDGMLMGDEIILSTFETPEQMLNKYFLKIQNKDLKSRK